uniref:PH domain-containing protein n=1 Tax=Peronospora matthiolae TaxID=2874970 RepID=A0AAV1T4Q0_9STRA
MPSPSQAPIAGMGLPLSAPSASHVPPPVPSTALLASYLLKQSAGKWKRKRWNQRWFVLDQDKGVLRYFRYASPLASLDLRQDAHGVLQLKQKGVSLVVQGRLPAGVPLTPFCFSILYGDEGQQEVRLCADSDVDFRKWTMAVAALITPLSSNGLLKARDTGGERPTGASVPSSLSVAVDATVSSPLVRAGDGLDAKTTTRNAEVVERVRGIEVEPRQVIEQMYAILCGNKTVLLALNPAIVIARCVNMSTWCFVALVANAVVIWLLWFRKMESHYKYLSSRPPSRTNDAIPPPTSCAQAKSDFDDLKDESSTKLEADRTEAQASSSCLSSKRALFLGKIDGIKVSAGFSLKMGTAASTETGTGCWTHVDATRFDVRQGPNYRKTKLKSASASALLELVAVDIYQSDVKVDNVGSVVNLSVLKPVTGDLDLFIVNCQVPSYQPSNPLWGEKQSDGAGFNFVTYFAIPPAIREMLDRREEPSLPAVRLLKDFMQPDSWASERFKAIGVVANPQEQQLGRAERHLLETYNGQPILTRPQHEFHRGDGYFEVDVNAHDFNYIARKGLVGISSHACSMVLDFGFVLEGQEDHELPEQILGCVRLCKVDICSAPSLS